MDRVSKSAPICSYRAAVAVITKILENGSPIYIHCHCHHRVREGRSGETRGGSEEGESSYLSNFYLNSKEHNHCHYYRQFFFLA
ncbi:hypothetical protein GDO81_026324 [Engystomops pustulosus]|uniref:Uncharacterized protein n=1 Tax=Engystomops pustulosus TaxID=76066 RepID=A0AAV6YFX9_ENGPU|nr:hypothetical protein GDO81_026324 [Engystomops pustulosus]